MNTERLYAIAASLKTGIDQAQIKQHLSVISKSLTSQANQGNSQNLENVAKSLDALKEAIENSELTKLPKAWLDALDEMGASDLNGFGIWQQVNEAIKESGGLYNLAAKKINELVQLVNNLYTAFENIEKAFAQLKMKKQEIPEGKGLIDVTFPRELFDDKYARFIEKQQIVEDILSEALYIHSGHSEDIEFFNVECSDPSVQLLLDEKVIGGAIALIYGILKLYEKLLQIDELKKRIRKTLPNSQNVNKAMDGEAEQALKKGIDEFVNDYCEQHGHKKHKQSKEINERKTALRRRIKPFLADLMRGLKIKVDYKLTASEDKEDEAVEEEIRELNEQRTAINDFAQDDKHDFSVQIKQLELQQEEVVSDCDD